VSVLQAVIKYIQREHERATTYNDVKGKSVKRGQAPFGWSSASARRMKTVKSRALVNAKREIHIMPPLY